MVEKLDAKYVKDRIFKYLEEHGPELPVHIAKYMSMNSLFTSAFLSEMAGEGLIKISDMKVGGSPLYYSPSKVALIENYVNSLGGKEREACLLLKEKGILEDSEQHPAIRVALRGLKDFAFPFKKDDKVFWRYFLISENEVRTRLEVPAQQMKTEVEIKPEIKLEEKPLLETETIEKMNEKQEKAKENIVELERINKEIEEKKKELEKLKTELENPRKEKSKEIEEKAGKKGKKIKIKPEPKIDESFLNEIKPLLAKKQIEIIETEFMDKKQIIARVKMNNTEMLLTALNKKKLEEDEMIKISKLAALHNLPYTILLKGDLPKKTKEIIEAYKRLSSIEKIE